MPYSILGKNAMLNALGTLMTHIGAFTDFPADSGAGSNEVAGGSYARQPISYDAAATASKAKAASPAVLIPIPGGTTVYFTGGFSASSAGTMYKWAPVNGGSVKGVALGADTGDVLTSYAHGLVNGDRVSIIAANGEALPTGLSATVLYYVVGATTDTFQVSLTLGGAAVAITADGECSFQKVAGESFVGDGNLEVAGDTLDLLG